MIHDFQISITSKEDDSLVFIANTADTKDTLSLPGVGGYVLYLQNTSTSKIIEINKIMASASMSDVVLRWVKGVTIDNDVLANNNVHTPVNINGNEKATDIVCFNWDEVGNGIAGIGGGVTVKTFILDIGHTPIKTKATLGAFDNIGLHMDHPTRMPEIECGIQFSYRDVETEAEIPNE